MSTQGSEPRRTASPPTKTERTSATVIGVLITVIYVIGMCAYAIVMREKLLSMAPNEFGDFLAGAFGPLALFWLVCGYFQQGVELRQNTRALELQASSLEQQVEELKQSVEHQGELAEAARKQLEFAISDREERLRQEEARFSPDLRVSEFQPHTYADSLFDVKLTNDGAEVSVLEITSKDVPIQVPAIGTMKTADSLRFRAMQPRNARATIPIVVQVRYRDLLGKTSVVAFRFKYNPDLLAYERPEQISPSE